MRGRLYDPLIARFLSPDPVISGAHLSEGLNPYSYVFNSPMNWVDPSGFQADSGDAATYASPSGCPDCSGATGDSGSGYDPLGTADANGNLTTSPDIAGIDAFPSGDFAGTPMMPAGGGSWSPGSAQTGDVVPSEGTPAGIGSVTFSGPEATPSTQDQSVSLAGGPVVLVGIAACLAEPPCAAALGMAAILAFEGLKKATEAIVRASDDSTPANEKEVKKAEKALRINQDFRRWFHREYKPGSVSKDADRINPDLDPEQVLDAYEEWLAAGSPKVK